MVPRRHFGEYTIVGQAVVAPNEPSPLSADGKVLNFVRVECARTGMLSCYQAIIAKATELDATTVSVNMRKLNAKGFIRILPGRPNLSIVPGLVGAFPGEPPAFSTEEAMLKVMRDECGGQTRTLSYKEIAKPIGCASETVRVKLTNLITNNLVFVIERGLARRPSKYAAAAPDASKRPWILPGRETAAAEAPSGSERKALFARMRAKVEMSYKEFEDFAHVKSEQLRDWLRWRPGKRAYKDGE